MILAELFGTHVMCDEEKEITYDTNVCIEICYQVNYIIVRNIVELGYRVSNGSHLLLTGEQVLAFEFE